MKSVLLSVRLDFFFIQLFFYKVLSNRWNNTKKKNQIYYKNIISLYYMHITIDEIRILLSVSCETGLGR